MTREKRAERTAVMVCGWKPWKKRSVFVCTHFPIETAKMFSLSFICCGTKPQRARSVQNGKHGNGQSHKIWAKERTGNASKGLFEVWKQLVLVHVSAQRSRVWHNQTAEPENIRTDSFSFDEIQSALFDSSWATQGKERDWFRLILVALLCFQKSIWIKKLSEYRHPVVWFQLLCANICMLRVFESRAHSLWLQPI